MLAVYASADQRLGPRDIAAFARRVEAMGYDGLHVPDAVHDGLVLSALALAATRRLRVATSVLVAFPRSPMNTAHAAWDLQAASAGRFELGLGSQVRGNIVRRYGAEWTPPIARMREYVLCLRAIFASFRGAAPLRFEGEQIRITSLQPFFNPGDCGEVDPPIILGGVGPRMTALAGEVADGLVTHPTASAPRALRALTLPRLEEGATRAGRSVEALERIVSPLVATGPDTASTTAQREERRQLLGFLFSTPSYWPTLELFGWKEIGERLHTLSREGKWAEMPAQIHDELLDTLVPSAPYPEIADRLRSWYGDVATRITFPVPDDPGEDTTVAGLLDAIRA